MIEIVDADGLAELPIAEDAASALRLRHLRLLVGEGAARLIANAEVSVRALCVGSRVMPLVLPNPHAGNAAVCSPLTWYVHYRPDEIAKRQGRLAGWRAKIRALPLAVVARLGDLDRVVYVDNWLLSTEPGPRIDAAGAAAITGRLVELHPERAIVWRSVTPEIDAAPAEALQAAGYGLVRSREIHLLDARNGLHRERNNVRIDATLLERTTYEIVAEPERLLPHARRLADLYRAVYVDKYAAHNPRLGEAFFAATLSAPMLSYRGLLRDGRLDGFVVFWAGEGLMWSCLLGHDTTIARDAGLYRLLLAILIREAGERRAVLHMGSGAGTFKALRGARPADEFDAVYTAHLPRRRQLAWKALAAATNRHCLVPPHGSSRSGA